MYTPVKNAIIELAKSTPNIEICGFIYLDFEGVKFIGCENISKDENNTPNPHESFEISDQDYNDIKNIGELIGVYHSHPKGGSFSDADLGHAEAVALPQYVYDVPNDKWHEHIPATYHCILEGRQFSWGVRDCYALVRDYYRQNFKIYLSDFDRDENFDSNHSGVVMANVEKEGFYKIHPTNVLQKHDILIFNTNLSPQHFGIFIGNTKILHHPLRALSRIDMLTTTWNKRLKCVIRWKNRIL